MDSDVGEENGGPVSWLVYRCAWVENRWTGRSCGLWSGIWAQPGGELRDRWHGNRRSRNALSA